MVEVTTLDEPLLPALLAFLRRVYPSPHKGDEAYFRWRFFEGPFGPSGAAYAIARDGKEIIGQLGALRDRLEGRGRSEDVLWLVDMIIAPEARNDLIGVRLVRKVQQSARTILLSGAGPHMEKFYVALGFKKLVGNRTTSLPIRASHVAPAKIPRGFVRSVDAVLAFVRPHSVLGYLLSLAAGMRIEKDAIPNDPRIDLLLASEPEAVRCASTPAVRSWRGSETYRTPPDRPFARSRGRGPRLHVREVVPSGRRAEVDRRRGLRRRARGRACPRGKPSRGGVARGPRLPPLARPPCNPA
ncbi:MAG: GNAT family N-acetyltransferase [Polyangiaceae bacterium]|nr:GNAT family N-acetyltransferase [Polyangiaceae bacterium]